MTKWKKILKIYRVNPELDMRNFIKEISLFIKQCHRIVWNIEKIKKIKTQKLQGQSAEE